MLLLSNLFSVGKGVLIYLMDLCHIYSLNIVSIVDFMLHYNLYLMLRYNPYRPEGMHDFYFLFQKEIILLYTMYSEMMFKDHDECILI